MDPQSKSAVSPPDGISEFDPVLLRDIPDPFADDLELEAMGAPTFDPAALPSALTRASVRRLRWIAAACALVYEIAVLSLVGLRLDLGSLSGAAISVGLLAPLVAAALALAAAEHAGPRGVGAPSPRVASFLLLPVGLFALSTFVSAGGAVVLLGRAYWVATAACVAGTTMMTAGPLVLATIAFRRAFAATAAWRTAAIGVACGAFAAAAMHLHCAIDGQLHYLLGHGAALVVGGLAGLVLARFTRA